MVLGMTDTVQAIQTTTVTAEDAPIGIQLWPTTSPEFAPNFTLAAVEVVIRKLRDQYGDQETSVVVWTYESGNTRTFGLGEEVACQFV